MNPQDLTSRNISGYLGLRALIGQSPSFLVEVTKISEVAKFDVPVLIAGETGTGKDLFAHAIHDLSPRSNRPFIPINCGAIPPDLAENELFGHEEGAFTNALAASTGLVAEANGGTLFLDEIDSLPSVAQVKLLRFLQDKEYRPLGSSRLHRSDVRVISATNSNVAKSLTEGKLRHDLYYRLNTIQFFLPPLRERMGDISVLALHFLAKSANQFNRPATSFSAAALETLSQYSWPGNVRELQNTIERAVILSHHPVIQEHSILIPEQSLGTDQQRSFREMKASIICNFEKSYIRTLLASNNGNITQAAQSAKKHRRAFVELMRKHGLTK